MLKGRLSLFAPLELILFTLVLIGLHLAARNHYLLFHTLAELFSVNVALTIFVLTINSWQRIEHPYLRWIGVSYGFVAILDLFHSLAYPGMGVFRVHPFAAPQFWIQARFVEAFSMLLGWVGWHRARQPGLWPLLGGYVVLTAALLASVLHFNNFPVCFVSGHGLTPFKVFSEYLIIEVLLIDLLLLYQRRDSFSPSVWRLLAFSVLVAIVTEYAFTRYSSNQMSDPFNELGHVLKIVSFYLIYRALVVTGIQDPLKLLFRESQRRQSRLLEVQTLARLVAWEWSVERDVWQWSGDVQGIFGLWPGSLHNLSAFVSLLSPEEGKALQQALYRVARDGDRVALNLIIPGPEQSCYCRLEAQRGQNAFGSRVVVGSLQDISLQQRLLEMEQIQTRKNYLQTLLRQASDGIFILDRDGNILEASDSLHEMLGYERSQLLTMNMAHIDGHNGQFQDMLARQFEQTHRFQFETLYQRQDGSRLDVDVSGYPISFEGKLVLFYAVRDISRRKAIEASLQHERQLNEAILNLAGPMLLVIDRSGCILRFNRAAEHFTGFSFAQVQNQPYFWRRFLIEEERETVEQTFLRCFQGTLLETGENFWINAQGERRLIRWSNALLFEEEQPQALISVGIDVTALRASEQQLRIAATAFESQEGMVITDAKVRILKVNRAFQEITGYRMEELVGQNPKMLQSGRHDAAYYDSMWASIQQHGFWSGEIWNRRCNGEVYPEQLTITAVRDSSGQVTHYVGSLHDITDRKLSEAQIRQLAFYDLLTSLPNRRLFLDRLDQDIKRMARSGQKLALLFIDIDHFKEVNDLICIDPVNLYFDLYFQFSFRDHIHA